MSEEKLLPCPCGNRDKCKPIYRKEIPFQGLYHFSECSCGLTVKGVTIKEVVENWNKLPRFKWYKVSDKMPIVGYYYLVKCHRRPAREITTFYYNNRTKEDWESDVKYWAEIPPIPEEKK